MTQLPDTAIRRRPDGSIDTDFYARRAARLRGTARREAVARFAARLRRWTAALAAATGLAGRGGRPIA